MRFSRAMPWAYAVAMVALGIIAAGQTTHHARLMVQAGGTFITSVAFSPDGRKVLTGSRDKTARLWDLETGKELQRFEGHSDWVNAVAFSPDGRRVLTGGLDSTLRLWDVETGKELRGFDGHSASVESVAFAPDGRLVLAGSWDKIARLWDVKTGRELRRFEGHSESVTSVAFSPDGRKVLTGSGDKTARLWDMETGKELRRFEGHSESVSSVAFSPDGRMVLTGSWDKTARLWDVKSGKEQRRFEGHPSSVNSVAFSPDGHTLAIGSGDNAARLLNTQTGRELQRFEGHSESVSSVAFSPDGRRVLTGSGDKTARVWDAQTGKELQRFEGHSSSVYCVAFSPGGDRVAIGSEDNTARLWDVKSGKGLKLLQGHSSSIYSVAFSPDGRSVVTGSKDNTARLWDVKTGKELRRFEGHSSSVNSVAFSPDGFRVLTGSRDTTARLWDVKTGKELRRFEGHSSSVSSVAYSPNGERVLTGSEDKTARLWDVETGKELRRFEGHSRDGSSAVNYVGFSGNAMVFVGGPDGPRFWHAETGEEEPVPSKPGLPRSHSVSSVAFSPDGRWLLTLSNDRTARLLTTFLGIELQHFDLDSSSIDSAAFSGSRLLTGSMDGTARLWDLNPALHNQASVNAAIHAPVRADELRASSTDLNPLLQEAQASSTELASLVSFTDGGWAVVDPAGHYDASDPDSSASLYWVTDNLRTIDLGQLKKEYYTPGLLARVMRGERLPDVTGMNTVALPPVLTMAGGYNPATRKLPVVIMNDGGGVGRLLIDVNDRLLRTVEKPGSPAESKSITLPIDLDDAPFVVGDNTIRITAYDAANRIESHPAVAHYTKTVSSASAKGSQVIAEETPLNAGKFYAIVVGTSTFSGPDLPDLMFPAKDAESFATGIRLGAERLYGKDKIWMRVLTTNFKAGDPKTGGGLPTKQNIRAAFDEVHKMARPEDTLVVYLSGHGAMSSTDRDLYYYLTMDARTFDIERDPALKNVSTVSSKELLEWLREPVKTMPLKQVVILDTCAAGGASNDLVKLAETRDISPDQRRAIELLKDATGTFILMGSAADSVSYEASRYGEGLLTYALLQGMRGESLDDDSRLGVNRWFEKASEDVPDLAKSIGGIQKPVIAAPKGTGFPVALLTQEDRAKIPLATPKPQLVRVVCEDNNQDDPLQLRPLVREQLRALSYAQARGDGTAQAEIIYLDAADDDLPGALQPKLRYEFLSGKISVRIRLTSGNTTIADQAVSASGNDTRALAKMLATKIVAMAVEK
jgi:WD40 repeat protein